jgi:diaminohydroxyphosphoribosylaminopyrimidine deaminase/5-amino-6-(5-phosphoribosylamino)uracil reductase
MNAAFMTWAVTGKPLVTLKLATSLDGKVATSSGESRWISGPDARRIVHRWRADCDAVAVGIGTALADDPELTARDVDGPVRQPARVVFDAHARLPLHSALVRGAAGTPVIAVVGPEATAEAVTALMRSGVDVISTGSADRSPALEEALVALGEREIQSVLVEGGAGLAAALLAADAIDRVAWFVAPILIGGSAAPGALGDPGVQALADAPRLQDVDISRVGDDVLVTGRLRPLAEA